MKCVLKCRSKLHNFSLIEKRKKLTNIALNSYSEDAQMGFL